MTEDEDAKQLAALQRAYDGANAAFVEAQGRFVEVVREVAKFREIHGTNPPDSIKELLKLKEQAIRIAIRALRLRANILEYSTDNPFEGMALPEEL